jgi:hypothetical protein
MMLSVIVARFADEGHTIIAPRSLRPGVIKTYADAQSRGARPVALAGAKPLTCRRNL